MSTYTINYDLRGERDYEDLYEAIKSYKTWAHILESSWAVASTKSAIEIFDHLKSYTDSDDGLIVIKSGGTAKWKNVICKDSWLKDNL